MTSSERYFLSDSRQLIDDLGEPASDIRLLHPNTPSPTGEPIATRAVSSTRTRALVQEGLESCLPGRARMWNAVSKHSPPAAAAAGNKDGKGSRTAESNTPSQPASSSETKFCRHVPESPDQPRNSKVDVR